MILEVLRISGVSMAPTLSDGDFILALSDDVCARPPAIGSVVVLRHAELGVLVKRVLKTEEFGKIAVGGDNPMSSSSESLGTFASDQIIGRAFLRIPKNGFPRLIGSKAA